MIRTCGKVLRFCIGVSRVDLSLTELRNNPKIDFYPVVGRKQQKLGACILNQPANQNILTEEFVDELYRFLLSYDYDHSVENVLIESKDGVFSHGVDYKRLSEEKGYLDKLSKLAILVASINKPVMAQVAGGAKGAGAHLLSMFPMALAYRDQCFLKVDDVSRGMTPLFGGSHRLAKLPMHLGLYLALTSDELNFEEMTQLGYIKGAINEEVSIVDIRRKLEEANLFFREKAKYTDWDEGKLESEERLAVYENQKLFQKHLMYSQADILSQPSRNLNLKFAVNQKLAANADYYNVLAPHNSFSQAQGTTINNYFSNRLHRPINYLSKNGLIQPFTLDGLQLPRLDLARIDYIFAQDSLEQVMAALKAEPAEWAQRAHSRISSADPLAAHLTFRLIKQAENLPWINCLEHEFTVARRLLQRSTLLLKKYSKSSQYVLVNEFSKGGLAGVPREVVEEILQPGEGEYKLEHSVVPFALQPQCDYYQVLPDAVRKYLNREPLNDSILSQQIPEIKRYLNKSKINYSSQVFNLNLLRQAEFQRLKVQKEKEANKKRLALLARNDHFLQQITYDRETFLEALPDADLDKIIEEQLKETFREKFEGRFSDFEQKTAGMIGLEKKLELFKNIKDTILNNLLYSGAEYQNYQRLNTSFQGPIYFDSKGRDIYSSQNPHIAADPTLNQLQTDLSQGFQLSEEFMQKQGEEMPTYIATPPVPLRPHEQKDRKVWDLIKFRYDEKPEVWAQAYIYRQMIEQAARTSEELAGYLEWTNENFYDLLNYSQKKRETYGQLAADVVSELKTIREEHKGRLVELQKQKKTLTEKGIYSKVYQVKDEQKMRQCFPYLVSESNIPGQFRRAFLAVLDSTLKQLTETEGQKNKQFLFKEELGVVDKWINRDIASSYTSTLKEDVQYVSSYLQMLMVKDIIVVLRESKDAGAPLSQTLELIREHFNVDFQFSGSITEKELHAKIFSYLYFLMDLHSAAKKNIKSPQSKLIDFLNRLKGAQEQDILSAMPYSFETLLLMIGKDRQRIYDRYMGEQFISEPEFYLQHITRQAKKTGNDLLKRKNDEDEVARRTFGGFANKYSDLFVQKKKKLIQNYFYYMMLFEKHIHQAAGTNAFLPKDFVPENIKNLNQQCNRLFRPKPLPLWVRQEVKAIVQHLLQERLQAEKRMSKGELFLFDKKFHQKFNPANIRLLIKKKIEEEVYLLRNVFGDLRQYDFEANEEEIADEQYTRAKRNIRNAEALKKLNNLALTQEIYLEYMSKTGKADQQNMPQAEVKFAKDQRKFLKNGMVTRLPSKSYHRMARDLFAYPEQVYTEMTPAESELFKKTQLSFEKSVAEKIVLSNFTEQYKTLNNQMKDSILQDMADKIAAVESL